MKACRGCGLLLPMSSFYGHAQMADGHLNYCKDCVKARVSGWYAKTRAQRSVYDAERRQRPERKQAQAMSLRLHNEKHPDRYAARYAVSNAIRDGRLIRQPCLRCGTASGVQAHHDDYSKPLDVRWMCFKCHREDGHGQVVSSAYVVHR